MQSTSRHIAAETSTSTTERHRRGKTMERDKPARLLPRESADAATKNAAIEAGKIASSTQSPDLM
eukprot:scaffold3422_cov34-Prasinocladus_malaysianus.AAC.2